MVSSLLPPDALALEISMKPLVSQLKPISSEMMATIKYFESREGVTDISIKGIPVWPLLRVRWFFSEWSRLYTKKQHQYSVSLIYRYMQYFRRFSLLISMLISWRLLVPIKCEGHTNSDIVFFSDGISFTRIGDRWWDRFCDPIALEAEKMGLTSAFWSPKNVCQPTKSSSMWVAQPFIAFYLFAAVMMAMFGRMQSSAKECLLRLSSCAEQQGYSPSQFLEKKALADACRVNFLMKMFRRRLIKVRPRVAFIVSFYSLEGMSFVLACKKLGIPVVDIQHGVQGKQHPAYAEWALLVQESVSIELLPDCFWVWSLVESSVIREWSEKSNHLTYVGGNPWCDLWTDPTKATREMQDVVRKGSILQQKAMGRRVVLVTLQYGLDLSEQLLALKELIELVGSDYKFWVRLHPMMLSLREEVRELLGLQDIELDEVTDLPLPVILPLCDLHITHSSSVVIEASDFGIPSVITSRYGAEFFPEQLASGIAIEASGGVPEIFQKLQELEKLINKKWDHIEQAKLPLQGLLDLLEINLTGASA